jgi:hypothetical protein
MADTKPTNPQPTGDGAEQAKPDRNIIWVGFDQHRELDKDGKPVNDEPPPEPWEQANIAGVTIAPLPSAEIQRAGFFHPQARILIASLPGYRAFRENKGKKE